jgi:hypothetical protein
MIEELKLFATALKMNSAFLTVDKRSQVWIDEGWSVKTFEDLRKEAAESEDAYTFNELKNKFLDMKDDFEKAVKDLRGKLQRFETDPYGQGASPILRYERIVDQYGVKGKLFLGLNSHQAKGYRIVELDHPRWLEQLMQTDSDVFRSENLSEGEVYALVPSRGIDQEKLSVLNSDYFEDLEKAGVPAFDTFKGYKELKPEFISRFNKTVDTRLPFDTNVLRVQALVEQIKREHALAVPAPPGRLAVGPPAVAITAAVPSPKPVRPAPKYAKSQEVIYKGAEYTILDLAFQNGVWLYELNAPGVSLFRPENEIQPAPEQLLSIYTVQGVRFVQGFEDQGAAFRKADEMRKQFPGSVYRVVKPEVLQHKWHPFEVWLVNRGYEVPEKIRVAEPLKTVSTPLYTTAHVPPPPAAERPKPTFMLGDEVSYHGEVFRVLARRYDETLNNWQYTLRNPPLFLAPYQEDLEFAPLGAKPTVTTEEAKEEAKLEKEAEEEAEEEHELVKAVEEDEKEELDKLIEKREIEISWSPEVAEEIKEEDEETKKALAGRLSMLKDVAGWYPFREFSASVMTPSHGGGDRLLAELKQRGYNTRITLGGKSPTMGWLMARIYTDKKVPMPNDEQLKDLLYLNAIGHSENLHARVQEAYRQGGMKRALEEIKFDGGGSVGYGPVEWTENMDLECRLGKGCTLELENDFSQWSGRTKEVHLSWETLVNYAVNTPLSPEEQQELKEEAVPSVPFAAAPTTPTPQATPAAAPPTTAEIELVLGEIQKETADRGYAFQDAITFKTNVARGDGDKFKRIIKILIDSGQVREREPGSGIYIYREPAKTTQPTTITAAPKVIQPTAPAAPTYKPTKILDSEDMRLLQDYWNTQFIRAIGKIPAGFSSVFRIEFQEVKMLPFADAKATILAAADREIEGIESAQRARAVIRQGERVSPFKQPSKAPMGRREEVPVGEEEERLPLATGRVTPSAFPTNPLSVMQPFPRGPTSLEQLRLWKVFCYEMQQEGYDCNPYAKDFAEYIGKSQFLSWQDLQQKFEFFENTIMEGATLPPLVQWRAKLTTPTGLRGELHELEPSPEPAKLTSQQIEDEEKNAVKRQRILISHWAAALIHQARYYNRVKTMSDLYDEVVSRGVIDASIPEEIFLPIAKEAIREIYTQPLRPKEMVKTDDEEEEVEKLNIAKVPYADISQAEVDEFLATG